MRVITWILVASITIGLIAYGVTDFGKQTVSAETSQSAKGSFVKVDDTGKKLIAAVDGKETAYPLSSTVWVYRDMQKSNLSDLKTGDTLELILNSKGQAAYIKAAGPQPSAAAQPTAATGQNAGDGGQPAAEPAAAAPSSTVEAVPPAAASAPTASAAPAPSPVSETPTPSPAPPAAVPAPAGTKALPPTVSGQAQTLDRLQLEWKSSELQLRIKREGSGQGGARDVYIQTKDGAVVHLTGASAESFIQLLVGGLPTEQKAFEQQLKQKISSQFQLQGKTLEWKLDSGWMSTPAPVSAPVNSNGLGQEKKQDDNSKDKVNNKEKSWKKEDSRGNGHDQNQRKGKDKQGENDD